MIPKKEMLPHYTYDDYVLWEGKWELISGIPYAMSPAPTPRHQQISATLAKEFGNALENCKQCTVYDPIDYLVKEDTVLQPDLLIVCGKIEKKFLDFPPSLVVEMLSPSTAVKDRHTKFLIYEKQAIKYFVIISPERETVEVYKFEDGEYNLVKKGQTIDQDFSFNDCNFNVDISKIW